MILLKDVLIPGDDEWLKKDILIYNGVYRKVSESIELQDLQGCRRIFCEGRHLVPSFVDPHVHVREPGYDYKEDWESCSRAALKGGISAIFDMPNNKIPVTDNNTVTEKQRIALKKSYVNFGLYIALTDNNIDAILSSEFQSSVCGIKIYLSKTTGNITVNTEDALLRIFSQKKPVLVHTGGIDGLKRILHFYKRASQKYSIVPVLYICHISTGEELKIIKKWKKKFQKLMCEVSPHHLFLNTENYHGFPGVLPPLASKADNEALWNGIQEGAIELLGTDHAPHTVGEKKRHAPPSGFPGLETALPLMFSGLKEKRITLNTLIRLSSGNAKSLFHIGRYEGIVENEKADCTLLEEGEFNIGDDGYITKCGWSPFHGWRIYNKPILTIVNGCISYDRGRFIKNPIHDLCGVSP